MPRRPDRKPAPRGGPVVDLVTVPPVVHGDPWGRAILACPDHTPAGDDRPAPWCARFGLSPSREQCIKCLGGDADASP